MRNQLNINWPEHLKDKSTNESWKFFCTTLDDAISQNVPRSRPFKFNKVKPIWMNSKALSKVRKKHKAWSRYLHTQDGQDYLEYAKARNQAKNAVRKAVKDFERACATDIKSNPKTFWKYLNSKTRTKCGISQLHKNDGSLTHDDTEKAETLNTFFSSVFTSPSPGPVPQLSQRNVENTLSDIHFTRQDVTKKLSRLKISKSPGPDGHHPRIYKELIDVIAEPLYLIFRKSLDEGNVPDDWRSAHVTPIFKRGSKKVPGNYRPISLTSIACKIFESIVRDSITDHMDQHNLYSLHQHGFISGRSCITQLLDVIDSWSQVLDEGGCLDAIYLDFAKAFDTVPFQPLLSKLSSYGIQDKVLTWINAYLSNRRQLVCVNGRKSDWLPVTSGIPQGSVLGPLLFVIYINDLPECINSCCKLFADDTKIWRPTKTSNDCRSLQHDLDRLQTWTDEWQLRFNTTKCKVLRVGKSHPQHSYYMADTTGGHTPLEESDCEKDLGVWVDNQLSFKEHITKAVKKSNSLLGRIRRSFKHLDEDTLPAIFKAIVRPMLEYGNTVWCPYTKHLDQEIEKVQHRATKIIPSLRDLPYSERLRKLKLPTLSFRRLRGSMIDVFKYASGIYKTDLLNFCPDTDMKTRSNGYKLPKSRCHKKQYQHFFTNRVTDIWNSLPREVVAADSVNAFKNRLDKHWKNHPKVYDPEASNFYRPSMLQYHY